MRAGSKKFMIKAIAAALAAGLLFWSLAGCSLISGGGESQTEEPGQEASGGQEDPSGGADGSGGGASEKDPAEGGDTEEGGEGSQEAEEEEAMRPIEEGGHVFPELGTTPGNMACGGMAVTAEDGTIYAANISGSGTITRISPDGTEKVICDIEPWDEMRKVTHLNIWNGSLYFEIGPVFYYTLYYATYHWPINGIYRLDLASTDEYMKHYDAKEEGYEDLPEPVSVVLDEGAMGASYAEIAYYDPLVIGGKLYYWINNDYKKGRQLCWSELNGAGPEELYDSKDHKVISWTSDGEKIYVSDDSSIFSLDPEGRRKDLVFESGSHLQCYGQDLFYAVENRVFRMPADGKTPSETVLERNGMIREFNVYDGKIYFIEENGTESISSYIGIASGFAPEDVEYAFRYIADPDMAGNGNTLLKGLSLSDGRLYYTQSFAYPDGREIGDVSYVEMMPETGGFREARTGPEN